MADCTAHAIRGCKNAPEVDYIILLRPMTTWHDYAALVFEEARSAGIELAIEKLNPVPTSAYPTPARRPHSRLNTRNSSVILDWSCRHGKWVLNECLLSCSRPIYKCPYTGILYL